MVLFTVIGNPEHGERASCGIRVSQVKPCGLCEPRAKRGFRFGVARGLGFKPRAEGFRRSVVHHGGAGRDRGCGLARHEAGTR